MAQIINKTLIYRLVATVAFLSVAYSIVSAQTIPAPEREHLLNGLTILYAARAGDPNVFMKLRINSGAAFDLAGKAGTMALLADAMFPETTTKEYVAEQLGGRLDVSTTYDFIEVTISGKSSGLERMIELLRNALVNVNLSAESVATLREARLKELSQKQPNAGDIIDRAVIERLFGSYPYANPAEGTVASVSKIDRADLMLARERFLNADNATLVVIGGVDKARLMRDLRQILGPWQKSERIVPATFRQPGPVGAKVLLIDHALANQAEVRIAFRGLSRSDRDATAASLLPSIIKQRWQAADKELSSVAVMNHPYALMGTFMLRATVPIGSAANAVTTAQVTLRSIAKDGPSATEMEVARETIVRRSVSEVEDISEAWLDGDTYKPESNSTGNVNNVTPDDVRRAAARLFENGAPEAIVVMGNQAELKIQFGDNAQLQELPKPNLPATPATKKP
ncbi:MAG TPA: pitrilysin family protein [Pyrinomonadaceae bacterium]|jgi:zinc protease|nr:pitrilysin family protein [Pyrinomonadaceae bacterium]